MFRCILVPTDGSEITKRAIEVAIELAKAHDSVIYALSISDPFFYSNYSEMAITAPSPQYYEDARRIALARVQDVYEACKAVGVPCRVKTMESAHPWKEIVEYATDTQCDLIVMASHGRRGLSALLLGSETQKVLTHSKVPVLVVR